MAALLDTIYAALVLLVAVAGIAFVFYATGDGNGDEDTGWSRWALTLVVVAFLAVMVGGLLT